MTNNLDTRGASQRQKNRQAHFAAKRARRLAAYRDMTQRHDYRSPGNVVPTANCHFVDPDFDDCYQDIVQNVR